MGLSAALEQIATRPASAPFAFVVTPNAQHVVLTEQLRATLQQLQEAAWLSLLDSRVLQLLGRVLFRCHLAVATGSDLSAALFATVIAPDDPIVVIGGSAEMAARLRARYGLRHLDVHVPPYGFIDDAQEVARCIAFVRAHPARFVFVACGFPRSEQLCMAIAREAGMTGVGICVGASLLFLTGMLARAPSGWSRCGMEWLYRIMQEPRRLLPRLWHEQLPVLLLAARHRWAGTQEPLPRRGTG